MNPGEGNPTNKAQMLLPKIHLQQRSQVLNLPAAQQNLSPDEARRMLQEIRDRAEEREEELSARQSRSRLVERDW